MKNISAQDLVFCSLFLFSHLHAVCSSPFSHPSSHVKNCSLEETLALLHFKNSFYLSNTQNSCPSSYPKTNSWKEGSDCCSWKGVNCDPLSGHVIGLDLSYSSLSGYIHDNSSLFLLHHLQTLDLSCNDFSGSGISSFSYLEQLTTLDLSYNSFSGQFPDVFGNHSKITSINLSRNNFSGQLSSSVFNITRLYSLDFSWNQFSGHLPYHISGLHYLTYLNLSSNTISGRLPSWVIALPSLESLNLSFNNLTGLIEFEQFQQPNCSLTYVDLGHNKFHGPFPNSIFELVNLEYIYLSSNNLSGIIKADMFSKLKSLKKVDFSNNKLLALINTESVNFTLLGLTNFVFSSCNVTEFPFFLRVAENLAYLNLSYNRIPGRFNPKETKPWHTLECLDLSNNNFTSYEMNISMNIAQLDYLDLSNNMLLGSLMTPPYTLKYFSVSQNNLTGEIPPSFCSLIFLDLSYNAFSGEIPHCFSDILSVLDLRGNKLQGNIPFRFSESSGLISLNLNGNQLEGPLPRSLVNCRKLIVLDVGNNRLTDTFPHWLPMLELRILILKSNRFYGPVSNLQTSVAFSELQIIDISHNKFTGLLPTSNFKNFKAMMAGWYNGGDQATFKFGCRGAVHEDSVALVLKGVEYLLKRNLDIFTIIDFSSNRFEGLIPEAVGNLSALKSLNFSHNHLDGKIPSSLQNLTAVESLDLSSNNLTGHIPLEMTSLTSLSKLNLSYNQLSGLIPQGRQFNTFENDSYIGNLGLCGKPLTKTCGKDDTPGPPLSRVSGEEDDTWKWFWTIAMMGYGSGLVVGVSLTCTVFSTGRPFWIIKT